MVYIYIYIYIYIFFFPRNTFVKINVLGRDVQYPYIFHVAEEKFSLRREFAFLRDATFPFHVCPCILQREAHFARSSFTLQTLHAQQQRQRFQCFYTKNTGELLTGFVNTSELLTGFANTSELLTGFVNTSELLTGFVNTSELLTGFVNTSELLKDAP